MFAVGWFSFLINLIGLRIFKDFKLVNIKALSFLMWKCQKNAGCSNLKCLIVYARLIRQVWQLQGQIKLYYTAGKPRSHRGPDGLCGQGKQSGHRDLIKLIAGWACAARILTFFRYLTYFVSMHQIHKHGWARRKCNFSRGQCLESFGTCVARLRHMQPRLQYSQVSNQYLFWLCR